MVGVPGRSKGCITCRRRKKGCDLKQPSCGQCEARGAVCGGYDPDRIFLHATAPLTSALIAVAPPRGRQPEITTTSTRLELGDARRSNPSQFDILLPYGLANSACRELTLELFFSMYLPDCNYDNHDLATRPKNFTDVISHAYTRDEALKLAVIALGTSMLGKVRGSEEWARQGRRLYVQALKEMRRALLDQQRVNSEALLLVPRVAALFEVFFGADANPTMQAQSWRSHAQGELAMIKAWGPYAFREGLMHQIFVDSRLSPIIAAIRTRKASVLNNVEWKTIPWEIHPKTPKDGLMDILVGIPEILEDIGNLDPGSRRAVEDAARARIATKCRRLETQLQSWAKVHGTNLVYLDTEEPIKVVFSDLNTAYLTLYYWTASLFIYGALAIVSPSIQSAYPLSLQLTSTDALLYARRIARVVPYFLNSSCGIWGATAITFPMGSALLCLLHNGLGKNKDHLDLIYSAWRDPTLSSAIQGFLNSMRRDAADELKHGRPRFGGEFWVFYDFTLLEERRVALP